MLGESDSSFFVNEKLQQYPSRCPHYTFYLSYAHLNLS